MTINKTMPKPLLGPYPHLRLCGQLGKAPIKSNTRAINRIVPKVILTLLNYKWMFPVPNSPTRPMTIR